MNEETEERKERKRENQYMKRMKIYNTRKWKKV